MRGVRDAESMNTVFTDTLRQTAEALVPSAPRSLPTGWWCADPRTRQKMDDAFRDQDVAWEAWKRGKGTERDKLRWKAVKRTGNALKRAQQEGVVNFLEAHALELERHNREGNQFCFYKYMKSLHLGGIYRCSL